MRCGALERFVSCVKREREREREILSANEERRKSIKHQQFRLNVYARKIFPNYSCYTNTHARTQIVIFSFLSPLSSYLGVEWKLWQLYDFSENCKVIWNLNFIKLYSSPSLYNRTNEVCSRHLIQKLLVDGWMVKLLLDCFVYLLLQRFSGKLSCVL